MIALQLPSLQQIYDYSSSDLHKFAAEVEDKLRSSRFSRQEQQRYEDYLENIKIQLQQRKTLQFFQEICLVDNPYLQKVTDFNNQFLKLASEAIAAQQQTQKPFQKKQLHDIVEQIHQNEVQTDAISTVSAFQHKSRLTQNQSYKSTNGYQDKAYTVTSQKRSAGEIEKKLNIPMPKNKVKNNMKDFILSTLSKNKAEGCYVVKKSGGPQKPQPSYTVNERGHLVSANTLEPISTKSIKSTSAVKQKNHNQSSNKQIQSNNKINQKQLQKKRLEAIQKVKNVKSQKRKQKNFNNKDLLEMVRQQEREKQRKQKKKQLQRLSNIQIKKDIEKQNIEKTKDFKDIQIQNEQSILNIRQQIKIVDDGAIFDKAEQKIQQIRQVIEVQQQVKQAQNSCEQIKEEIKLQESKLTLQDKKNEPIQLKQKQAIKLHDKIQTILDDKQKDSKNDQICLQNIRKNERYIEQKQSIKQQKQIEQNKQLKASMNQLAKMNRQLQQQKQNQSEKLKEKYEFHEQQVKDAKDIVNDQNFGRIIDLSDQNTQNTSNEIKSNTTQSSNKKCYNQDYWIHIREQAQARIKRFKQQKQLQELSKRSLKDNIQKSMNSKTQSLKQDRQQMGSKQSSQLVENEDKISQVSDEDVFLDKKKKQLNRMISDHNKRTTLKKPPLPIIAPPKVIHPLPSFNYLEVYPTFNHIFSVMYTKAEHQALQDIPMIMKDLTNMFTTHMQHFKDKASYFKPAIFLPFDSSNNFQLSDPKQLLLHAENTYVNLKKIVERLEIFNGNLHGQFSDNNNRYYRVVKTKQEVYDIISTGFLRRKGWKELPHGCSLRSSWNLFWSWSKPDIDVSKLLVWQRINHFPFNKNLSRKDLLYKNLDSFRKMLKIPFNFLPLTYNLPKQFTPFSIKFHEEQITNRDLNYWIMKPIGKSRGRGIKVINNLAELNYTDNIIVQKYIINPLLLDGYKFDMRIYVLVTNFHPLEAFVYKEGFARLSTEKFSLEPMFIKNTFVHLTNFAINKNNEEAKQTAAFSGGSKISLKVLKDKIAKMGYSFTNIWSQVHQIIIKSLLGCSISVPPFPTAFELFGYDIMIDTSGACHLIEINASPSLERSYMIDEIVKQSLIDDILDIVDPPNFDKEQLLDIMSERLSGKKKITPQQDLISIARVLNYKPIRKFGQIPENIGLFEMIAPSKLSTDLQRQIKGRSGANNPKNID